MCLTLKTNKDFMELVNSFLLQLDKIKTLKNEGGSICYSLQNNSSRYFIFPGFCDVHVHFREPGFFYKESIESGSSSALNGGYTSVCTMPNLNPVPDTLSNLQVQLDLINKNSRIDIYPYASITINQQGKVLSNFDELAPYVAGFSDDGKGVQSTIIMEEAMLRAKALDKVIVAHCEDESLLNGGYIHDGDYAKKNGHKGISSKSEWLPIERDIKLAKKTGVKYHVCHISTKESVDLIRRAKKDGVDITCETAPHYILKDDSMLVDDGRYKMNPPIRANEDRLAILEGILDGTIDMIATDHAPHSKEEKSKGLKDSLNGVVGLETAFPVLYTNLVKKGIISLDKLVELMAINPRKRFNIPLNDSYVLWDLDNEYVIDSNNFLSKGKSTPFLGEKVFGECKMVYKNGKIVFSK